MQPCMKDAREGPAAEIFIFLNSKFSLTELEPFAMPFHFIYTILLLNKRQILMRKKNTKFCLFICLCAFMGGRHGLHRCKR
jgi:hypothetical protein